MSSFFNCVTYEDIDTTICLNCNVVFLALEDKEKNTSVHLTLKLSRTICKMRTSTRKSTLWLLLSKLYLSPDCKSGRGFYFLWRCIMPATKFICPDGQRIDIVNCLCSCPKQQRCMFLPTLRAVANSLARNFSEPNVTELIAGTREPFFKKMTDYAVDPASILYALYGQAVHSINERHTQVSILSEERLKDEITSEQFDLFGKILDADYGVLGNLEVTSSFKLMKTLGIYKQKVDTGEVYKMRLKKGQSKLKTEMRYDGVCDLLDWATQLGAVLVKKNCNAKGYNERF